MGEQLVVTSFFFCLLDCSMESFGNVRVVSLEETETSCGKCKDVKNGGPKNVVTEGRASDFRVRSESFTKTNKKKASGDALLSLVAADVIPAVNGLEHATSTKSGIVACFPKRQFFVVNLRCPSVSLVLYFVFPTPAAWQQRVATRTPPVSLPAMQLLKAFCSPKTTDRWRCDRLKFVPRIVEGPWLFRHVTPTAPAMIARHLKSSFFFGSNYCEVSIDVCSSFVARKIWSAGAGAAASIVVDLAFIIQGEREEELPEQVCAVARVCRLDVSAFETSLAEETSLRSVVSGCCEEECCHDQKAQETDMFLGGIPVVQSLKEDVL